MKTPPFPERGRFARNLKAAGLTRRQIQHVARLYGAGDAKAANSYLRAHGVTPARRKTASRTSPAPITRPLDIVRDLYDVARKAKRDKLGTDRYLQWANDAELREIIERDADFLRRRAGERRVNNPFWYHQGARPFVYPSAKRRAAV